MSPRPSLAAERKPQILTAAVRVIAKRGIGGTRLADVAAEAGLSVGAVQHYFGTRDRLINDAFAYESEQAAARWLNASTGDEDGWEQLMRLVDAVVDGSRAKARWARWLEFWAAAMRDPALRPGMRQAYEYWRTPLRRAIEAGVADGAFRLRGPVDDAIDTAVATFDGLALQVLLDGMPLDRMRTLVVAALADDLGLDETISPATVGSHP